MSNNTKTSLENPKLFADTNISMKSGRLVKDAEELSDGKFIKIRIATNKQYLDATGELKTNVSYFNALVSKKITTAFNTAKELKKGDWVYFKGEDNTQIFDTVEGYRKTETTTFAYQVTLKKEQSSEPTAAPA